ncbi:MAG: response regulator [Pseudomonadota bacterium]
MEASLLSKYLKVLLIEDDAATRDILSFFLKELGVTDVTEFSNAVEALQYVKMNPHWRGVVICDWNMPKMSGAAFYREIKRMYPDIPFIMVTGRNDEDSVHFAKDHGVYAYLLKPVALEELARKVSRVADEHSRFLALPVPHDMKAEDKENANANVYSI